MPSSDQQTLDIYKSNFTYVVEFDESSDHWWQNTEVKYMYTHKRVYSLYLIHFCNSQVGHVHTLQKFGMWDQINCPEKCFSWNLVKKSFTFPIFHFVVSLDNWVDLTFIISGKCIAITVKELFANKSNLILNDIHLDILNWMSVWHKIFKVKQRKSRQIFVFSQTTLRNSNKVSNPQDYYRNVHT